MKLARRWPAEWFSHGLGHEGRFAQPSPSAGYEFRKETIAGMHGNERDAPTAVVRVTVIKPPGTRLLNKKRNDPGGGQRSAYGAKPHGNAGDSAG